MNAAELVEALGGTWRSGRDTQMVLCPAHLDRNPSLAIREKDGKVLIHCHAGCPQEEVIEKLKAGGHWATVQEWPELVVRAQHSQAVNGSSHPTLQPTPIQPAPTPIKRIAAVYDYRDDCGQLVFQTLRYEPKDFRQRRPVGDGWEWNLKGIKPLVLYRLPELASTPRSVPVLLPEGEKDVDRLRELGLTATCNPMGAGKWRPEFTPHLKGRTCIILPDNDPSGAEHAGVVAEALLGHVATLKVLHLPDLPPKGDVSDWLDAGGDAATLERLIAETVAFPNPEPRYPLQTLAELVLRREDRGAQLVDGMLWAGRVHWVFSDPNTGKTLFLLAALLHVAAGREFCGRPVHQGPVLIIEEDSPLSVLAEYVETLADIYGFDLEALPIWCNKVQGLRITDDEGIAIAQEAVDSCPEPPVALVLDACERLVPSDKFNTKELDPFTRFLQRQTTAGRTPAVIDHTKVTQGDKAKALKPMDRLFGARAKSAISDVMLYLEGRLDEGPVEVQFAKFRGETPSGFSITFDPGSGFRLTDRPARSQAQGEARVLGYFRAHPGQWAGQSQVKQATGLGSRTITRWLATLAEQRWLIREQEDHGQHTQYQLNPQLPGVFE